MAIQDTTARVTSGPHSRMSRFHIGQSLKGLERREAIGAIKDAYIAHKAKVGLAALKLGVDKAWLTAWYGRNQAEDIDAVTEGDMLIAEGTKLIRATDAQFLYTSWLADQERNSISDTKRAGERIAETPSAKVKLLQKLGLNGAEFHALCLMVKEQIR